MSLLEIELFNGLQIKAGERPITRFYSQKTKGLLVYLVLEAIERPQARAHLATLLWPEYPDSRARRNLSQTLTSLRKDLGDQELATSLFDTTTQTIGLNPNADLSIDVQRFEQQLSAVRDHNHLNLVSCLSCTDALKEAAQLYSGPLLNQFDPSDSNPFEEWLVAKRENLLQRAIETFIQLGNSYAAQGRGAEGLQVVDRLLALAPWQEGGHRLRMLLLAQDGRRIQALNQYEILSDVLMRELGVSPAPETDDLYDRVLAGEIEVVAQPELDQPVIALVEEQPAIVASPFQAPPTSPYFVGRQREIDQIQQFIEEEGEELSGSPIALVGMGGVGKSALATFKAHQLKEQFPDGILWGNPLTSDPQNILDMWARAYGSDFSGLTDVASKSTAVRGLLAHKKTLIVLDNVEDAASVRPLLPSGGSCQVLLTTRNLEAATSLNAQLVHMREFSMESSHKLMARIIGKQRILGPPEQMEALQQISQQLHHLPLAIEIAAQRLRSRPSMPLAALAMRLGDTKQRLGLKISDQAVRTSFEVSWGGLTQLGQQVFAGMAVFAGRSFTAEALAAVVDFDLFDLEDELYSLIALSLVSTVEEDRFSQHPLLADFAAEKLSEEQGVLLSYQKRLVKYFLAYINGVGKDYSRLAPEWDNLIIAIQTASQASQWDQLFLLINVLTPAWKARGRYQQARHAYRIAHEVAREQGEIYKEAEILLQWGEASLEQSDYELARKRLVESRNIYRELKNQKMTVQAQYRLARIAFELNNFDDARKLLKECEAILKSASLIEGLGDILSYQGFIALSDEFRIEEAMACFVQALAYYEESGDKIGKIEVLRLQAQAEFKRKNFNRAENLALEAKSFSEKLHDRGQLASNLYALTTIYLGQGKLELAKKCGEDSLVILKQTGLRQIEGLALRQLSRIHRQLENFQVAIELSEQSLAIFSTLGILLSQAFTLKELAELFELNNRNEDAKLAWQTALQYAKQLHNQSLIEAIQQNLN